ncbi:MAG: hypothetical protein IKN30_07980, partial [Synergistaceae bacterium]|nr:hypothetical protein [Synergistaceae bacterium]
ASASSIVRLSATKLSNVENLKAYNKSGDIIPVIASDDNGNITFASAPDIMTYDYNIGFNNTSMDVTVYASNGNSNNTLSGSGGGCSLIRNEGLGIRNVLILLLLFVLAPLKIKKI